MIITFTNVIGAIRTAFSVVTTNLKMWLGFETSETLGREEVLDTNFTAGNNFWEVETPDAEIDNGKVNFNTSRTNFGFYKNDLITSGKQYKVVFTINSYTSGAVHLNIGGIAVNSYDSEDTYIAYFIGGGTNDFGIQSDNGGAILSINSISVKEVTQITPDKSGNNNVGELFTGKALEFDGVNDIVDFTSFTTPIKCAVFWVKPLDTGLENILWFGGAFAGSKSIRSNGNVIQTSGLSSVSVYVDGVQTTSVPLNQWSRVVVNFASVTPSELKLGYAYNSNGYIQLSNVQLYNENLTTDDIAYDYANPQNLVTDRSGTSIALSNLKGYWALSEGSGSLAYDSSGEGNNGTINGATYELAQPRIPQLGMQNWSKGSNLVTYSEDFTEWTSTATSVIPNATTSPINTVNATKIIASIASTTHQINKLNLVASSNCVCSIYAKEAGYDTFEILDGASAVNGALFDLNTETVTNKGTGVGSIESVGNGWYRCSAVMVTTGFRLYHPNSSSSSSGDGTSGIYIWGAQLEQSSSAGAYRLTDGAATLNSTVIPNPTIPTQDILGNAVRDRLNSFNLDGSGYAEVAEVVGLDVTDFSIEAWVKFDYTYSGSSINVIYVNGGSSLDVNTFALTTDEDNKVRFIVGGTIIKSTTVFSNNNWVHIAGTRESNAMKLYINGDTTPEATGTSGAAVNNALDLRVGRDEQTNRFYKERISDVRLYGAPLSADEVENNYNAGLSAHTN